MNGIPPRLATASARRRTRSMVKSSRRRSRPSGCAATMSSFGSSSDNARLAFAPITIADQPLVELARRMARQLAIEIDASGTFDRRKVLTAIGDQLFGHFRVGVGPVHGLDDGLHLLAEIFVRHADDRHVGDL